MSPSPGSQLETRLQRIARELYPKASRRRPALDAEEFLESRTVTENTLRHGFVPDVR
ncbi:MAG: hypothetical protein QOD06_1724 [Candidatus Binatota bacterium]|nr:hypothetical protein [Candidatus Binatota bacterium]